MSMDRREFIQRFSAAIASAAVSPSFSINSGVTAAPVAAPVVANDISNTFSLFVQWTYNAKAYTRLVLDNNPNGIRLPHFNRMCKMFDNRERSFFTKMSEEKRKDPAMKALLDVYAEEMQQLQNIVAGRGPHDMVTQEELTNAMQLTADCWKALRTVAKKHPALDEKVREVEETALRIKKERHAENAEEGYKWIEVVHGSTVSDRRKDSGAGPEI